MDIHQSHTERTYVTVNSDFDPTGFMKPRSITWKDGRTFLIDEIKDFRPASYFKTQTSADSCYTVTIRGEEKYLFFEKTDSIYSSTFGRWFVEKEVRND